MEASRGGLRGCDYDCIVVNVIVNVNEIATVRVRTVVDDGDDDDDDERKHVIDRDIDMTGRVSLCA